MKMNGETCMKTTIRSSLLSCVMILILLLVSVTAAAEPSPENLLGGIFTATRYDEILKRHSSFSYTETSENDHTTYYSNGQISVSDWREDKGIMRIRTGEFDVCLFDDGAVSRWVNFETDKGDWDGLEESMLNDTILNVETQDGVIRLTTRPGEQERLRIINDEYADVADREKIQMRKVYEASADTLELMSMTYYDTMPDGSEITAWEMRFTYDADLPYGDQIDAVRAHYAQASGCRTTTVVFDEDTLYECTYVFVTPIGDNCVIPEAITKDGVTYSIDRERSVLTNEAKDNDAVLYMVRSSEG